MDCSEGAANGGNCCKKGNSHWFLKLVILSLAVAGAADLVSFRESSCWKSVFNTLSVSRWMPASTNTVESPTKH